MQSVNISSAKAHLSSLLKKLEETEEEIIIERAGKPIAKILKYKPISSSRHIHLQDICRYQSLCCALSIALCPDMAIGSRGLIK